MQTMPDALFEEQNMDAFKRNLRRLGVLYTNDDTAQSRRQLLNSFNAAASDTDDSEDSFASDTATRGKETVPMPITTSKRKRSSASNDLQSTGKRGHKKGWKSSSVITQQSPDSSSSEESDGHDESDPEFDGIDDPKMSDVEGEDGDGEEETALTKILKGCQSGQIPCNSPVRQAFAGRIKEITPDGTYAEDVLNFNKALLQQAAESMEEAKRLQHLKREYEELKRKCSELESNNQVLKITKKKKVFTVEQKQIINDVSHEIAKTYARTVKFPKNGWDNWSTAPTSCCAILTKAVDWAPGSTEEQKRAVWEDLIKPCLPRMMTQCKNRITQEMRKTFYGEH